MSTTAEIVSFIDYNGFIPVEKSVEKTGEVKWSTYIPDSLPSSAAIREHPISSALKARVIQVSRPIDTSGEKEVKWIPLERFTGLNLQNVTLQIAFEHLFQNRLWLIDRRVDHAAQLVLKKGVLPPLRFSGRRRLIINLIGTSGCGKGTQGEMLRDWLGLPHLSIGDKFRDEFRAKTRMSELIDYHDRTDPRNYVPDEMCLGIAARVLAAEEFKRGVILDGFPRTPEQARILLKLFCREDDIHIPVVMHVEEALIRTRLKDRHICPSCGHQVRSHDDVPRKGYCPKDGTKLKNRAEDVDEAKLERRFRIFRENYEGIVREIKKRDPVHHIYPKPDEEPERVFAQIAAIVDRQLSAASRDLAAEESSMLSPSPGFDLSGTILPVALGILFGLGVSHVLKGSKK